MVPVEMITGMLVDTGTTLYRTVGMHVVMAMTLSDTPELALAVPATRVEDVLDGRYVVDGT
tara:strand:- start:515 stop:697 length:183 start_codon:yes stop_codon:yes gene_type:complete